MDGGGHERGMRSGTLNVPGIVGFGKRREICASAGLPRTSASRSALRELFRGLQELDSRDHVNGSMEHRLPHNLNISFAFVEGEALMMAIKDVAVLERLGVHVGASLEPSYVLHARSASATSSRTPRSASASAASTPRKRSTT
jgi:cysteine desulfurase